MQCGTGDIQNVDIIWSKLIQSMFNVSGMFCLQAMTSKGADASGAYTPNHYPSSHALFVCKYLYIEKVPIFTNLINIYGSVFNRKINN